MSKQSILARIKAKRNCVVVGFLEKVNFQDLSGWAFSRDGAQIEFAMQIDGVPLGVDATWSERQDVADNYESENNNLGFTINLSGAIKEHVTQFLQQGQTIELLANGELLPLAKGVVPVLDAPAEPEKEKPRANIEKVQYFVVSGWGVSGETPISTFELLCNGVPTDCTIVRKERRDVAESLHIESLKTGFDIELPGYIWENVAENGICQLELCANGLSLSALSVEVNRAQAAEWIEQIAQMAEGPEKQYYGLLALEHLRYGKLFSLLVEEAGQFFLEFARQMQLDDFVFANADDLAQEEDIPAENPGDLLLWEVLRNLNARLVNSTEAVFPQVKAVLDELIETDLEVAPESGAQVSPRKLGADNSSNYRLIGEVRERYLISTIPLLCRHGEFLHLQKLIDFASLCRLSKSTDLWEMTLAIAPLAAEGQIAEVTELLYRISKALNAGWMNTECIRFAAVHVRTLEAEDEISLADAESFRYAFITFLDSFKGDWFSRLHDRELIDAMIELLADLDNYTDYHRCDLISAAVRHYGLCPTFWERLGIRSSVRKTAELIRAETAFKTLRVILEGRDTPLTDRLEELFELITFFSRQNNSEALNVLREVIANNLPHFNRELNVVGKALIETLLASDPAEALRISAFPLAKGNNLQSRFSQTNERLFQMLRDMSEHDKSVVYTLQCSAAATLQSAHEAAKDSDLPALRAALDKLEFQTIRLANFESGFLGADLLASAYLLAVQAGFDTDSLLLRFDDMVGKSIRESTNKWYLPLPVCVALMRLGTQSGDVALSRFLNKVRVETSKKFSSIHDALFSQIVTPRLAIAHNGWPQDTLVVIYSCRKYLDTRVQAIRETWVEDLKARGIPYLILVGDGDDSIQDDVLALNVSDKYEDLPQKSLKLFDWIYKNTDAQYVLKIDDDCFLDVDRYFDSLSYRKYNYYGRVIRRGVGSMDRAWHQSKSHSQHGQKAIDKSPEPSTYADGGGAYCLSRLAMLKLLEAEKTPAGERLVACSFMEDKLVGDLLALSHIEPSNEDYESYQRRRTFGEAMPVGMWENTFFPGKLTPTKVVHLDTDKDLVLTRDRAASEGLWPKKLWPTCQAPEIKLNSNQLELLTDPAHTERLLQQEIIVVSVVRNEIVILSHFLEHYRAMGIKCFVFVDNCSDDGSREYLYSQPDVVLYSSDTEYKHSNYGVSWQQAVLGNLCLGKWVLLADADELLVFPGCEKRPLADFVAEVENEGADAVRIDMIDMYPYGDLGDADFKKHTPFEVAPWFDKNALVPWCLGSGWFSTSTGFVSHLRHRMVPNAVPHDFVSQKYALLHYQPWVRLSQGVHYAANLKVSSQTSCFAHFKYHAGLKEKVQIEIRRAQHYNNAAEYQRYAAMLAEGQGGFGEKGVSVRYEGSKSFSGKMSAGVNR